MHNGTAASATGGALRLLTPSQLTRLERAMTSARCNGNIERATVTKNAYTVFAVYTDGVHTSKKWHPRTERREQYRAARLAKLAAREA